VLGDERLEPRGLRPPPQSRERDDFVAIGEVDHHRRHAGELNLIAVQHAERHARGHAGVDRVAARLEHRPAGFRGEIVPGRDHEACARDHGLERHGSSGRLS
jgi:hypothetical protein